MKKRFPNRLFRYWIACILILFFTNLGAQETKAQTIINGKVTNPSGDPLESATVNNKNSKKSTVTNAQGDFSIAAKTGDVLEVSHASMKNQTITIKGTANLSVTLGISEAIEDEVIVVGYGTQKKVNLSGSVSTVSGKTIAQRPAPNLQNLLQGRVAGLDVVQPTGEPGRDNGALRIRGLGSYGASSSPLILVDGVIASINNLSPQDIESVTVLKDAASASIYGARAANGVILITTKKGKAGKNVIEYSGSWATSEATAYPDLITNSVTYMDMYNQANARSGRAAQYTQAQIDLYKANPNSEQYPNFNWLDYVLGKGPYSKPAFRFLRW